MTKTLFIRSMHGTTVPFALTEPVKAAAPSCHPVSSISGSRGAP